MDLVIERKIEIGGREFEIEPNFKKSIQLAKFRNKIKYNTSIEVTEENKKLFEEINQLRAETKEGKMPDMNKLSLEAMILLRKMSDDRGCLLSYEESIEAGKILFDIDNDNEIEKLYNDEMKLTSFDDLITKLLYSIQVVFMSAKDGFVEKKKEDQVAMEENK